MNKLIDDYFALQKKVHEAFGYVEDWVKIPMEDSREYFWFIEGDDDNGDDDNGEVLFAETKEALDDIDSDDIDSGDYYLNEIYTQRFLSKWVYRTEDFTMICVDTHCDGNKYLQIFDNEKEIK